MKKLLSIILTAVLLLSSTSLAFAHYDEGRISKYDTTYQQSKKQKEKKHQDKKIKVKKIKDKKIKDKKKEFKLKGSPIIKFGRYKLPISPINKGMGATVTYDKETEILTVIKDTTTLVIDFKNKMVTINGVEDTTSGIFSASNSKKTTVLIKYIARILGVRVDIKKDKITVETPGLEAPKNIIVTSIGSTTATAVISSSLYITATADIAPGQATGGRAELYVGSRLIATDAEIAATDSTVTFTTSDGTPTNAELQIAVPEGGPVSVKLFNASNQMAISKKDKTILIVDYVAPTVASIISATYDAEDAELILAVTGAGAVGDYVDVTKLSFYDTSLAKSYQLTNASYTGSKGEVKSAGTIKIKIGSADKLALLGFGTTTVNLNIAAGPLLYDKAGNISNSLAAQTVLFTVDTDLDQPRNVTVTSVGSNVLKNTINSTTLYVTAAANITAGQATGGKAELYVGSKLVATDSIITATDTIVTFTTSDETPTSAELMTAIPAGGVVSVKLYNAGNESVNSSEGNPKLVVDYVTPTITGITSAIYNVSDNQLYINANGAGEVGDKVDVTKLSLFDTTLAKSYPLTTISDRASNGSVISVNMLTIKLSSYDKFGLAGFGGTTVYLNIAAGSLLTDDAGNSSPILTAVQNVPVTIIK
ncbi:MAG TPA: stalk domain-containing protein [Mobilitalea sp.]|nr:stalk domain-containing protein [Mobilitalea sp.]